MMKRFGIFVLLLALIWGPPSAALAGAPVLSNGWSGSSQDWGGMQMASAESSNAVTPQWNTPLVQANLDAPGSQAPRADFSANPLQGKVPLSVYVNNTSTGTITSHEWKLGTLTVSRERDPSPMVFTAQGEYTVSLTVCGPAGCDTKTRPNYIKAYRDCLPTPNADFTMDPAEGIAAHPVTFLDQSTGGVVFWTWDFGDGSPPIERDDPEVPVTHTYAAPGDYDVTLTVRDFCDAEAAKTKTLTILAPYCDFSADPERGTVPLTVTFTDQSRGTFDTRVWHFGDGTDPVTNPSAPITHTYQQTGTYTVRLEVSGLSGNLQATRDITVLPPPPEPEFTADPTEGRLPLTVTFTDQSTGVIDTRTWDFGDGSAPVVNPQTPVTHAYMSVGEYTVSLTVSGPGGENTLAKANHIRVIPNRQPVARVAAQQIFLKHIGEKATLDASPSSDPDGDKLFFSWREFRDNPHLGLIPTGSDALSQVHLYFPAPGRYRYDVRVSDGDLMSADTLSITVYVPGRQGLIGYTPSNALVRVPDAQIRVFRTPQDAANNVNLVDLAISDSLGRYTLEHVEPVDTQTAQTYTARVERTGFVSTDNLTISIAPDPGVGVEQHKHHIGRGYLNTMTGRVRTPAGAGITGVHVSILPGPGGIPYADTTDGNGRFTLANVPKGAWIMQLHAAGYQSEVRDVNIHNGMPELDFTLQAVSETATGTLTGRVLLAGTNHPVQGAKVTLGTGAEVFSDAQGVYKFTPIPLGDYILTVTSSGFEPQRLPAVRVRAGTTTLNLPISYTNRGPTVFGEVTDQASGNPVRLATVGIQSAADLLIRSDITDYTGYYQMRDVPTGQQTLRINAPGYVARTLNQNISGSMAINVQLERVASWVPLAPVPGRPEAAVAPEFFFLDNLNESAFLDAGNSRGDNLRYVWRESPDNPVLGLVPAGSENLSRIQISGFSKPGIYIYELQVKSGDLLSANTAAVTVLAPGLSGNVHASPSDGIIGLSNANVRAYASYDDALAWNPNQLETAQTEDIPSGDFALKTLSAGSYWIVARAAEGTGFLQYGPVKRRISPASAARQTQINVPREEFSLSGVIRDAATNTPLENVRVVAAPGSLSESYRTTTDAQGRYRLPVVPRGSQEVLLMREGYKTQAPKITISANMTRDFTLEADASAQLATLSGFVFAQYQGERLPVYNAEVIIGSGLYRTFTDANGYYEIAGMPPGHYFGTIRKQGYIPRGLADSGPRLLEAGDNQINRLLPFTGNGPVIRGTVVTDQGTTIPGVTIMVLPPAGQFSAWLNSPHAAVLLEDDKAYLDRARFLASSTGPAQSDAGGVFQMLDMPHGPRDILATLPDNRVLRQTINVDGNQEVVLNESDFRPGVQWTLTYRAEPGGRIDGPTLQTVIDGGSGTSVTAVSYPGCRFLSWNDGLTTAERQDTNVTKDIDVTAQFSEDCLRDVDPGVPDGGGHVTGGGRYPIGSQVEFRAIADPGYIFSHWTLNGQIQTGARAVHTFTIADNMILIAHFKKVKGLPGVLMLLLDE